jgi:hypothetical protein
LAQLAPVKETEELARPEVFPALLQQRRVRLGPATLREPERAASA